MKNLSEQLANDPSPRLTLTVKLSISTHKPGKIHNNDKGYSCHLWINNEKVDNKVAADCCKHIYLTRIYK